MGQLINFDLLNVFSNQLRTQVNYFLSQLSMRMNEKGYTNLILYIEVEKGMPHIVKNLYFPVLLADMSV